MARQTSFRFTVAATPAVEAMFARHAGAARFAYNQCLREVTGRLRARRRDRSSGWEESRNRTRPPAGDRVRTPEQGAVE